MIITKKALPRRALLQGVGASLALPLLDAMIPAMTALAATPAKTTQRLGYIYVPMGSNQAQWTPAETGKLSRLSPTLHSLSPFLDQVTVISNLENKPGYSTGNHATSNSSYLSCAKAKLTDTAEQAKRKLAAAQSHAGDGLATARGKAGEYAHVAQEKAGEYGRYARRRFDETLDQEPLVIGAIGLAVGAAIGAALPASPVERRYFGPARSTVVSPSLPNRYSRSPIPSGVAQTDCLMRST